MREFSEQELIRREKAKELEEKGIDPFGHRFDVTSDSKQIKENYADATVEELEEKAVAVVIAGRIMTKRGKGKAGFIHIQDKYGQIQVYVKIDNIGEEAYEIFKKSDIGDIVGRVAFARPKIIRSIQNYLDNLGYVEVETPILGTILGGANARPFTTHHNTLDIDMYLRIATELPLKRLLVGGMDAVYEIGRIFRNEGMDRKHNPEFTTIELYKAYTDLEGMMDVTENIIGNAAMDLLGTYDIKWRGHDICLKPKFKRIHMVDAIREATGINFFDDMSFEDAKKLAEEHGITVEDHYSYGHIINDFFEKYVEETIIQPTFITGHPIEISPLAKKDPNDPRFTQRFELFIVGSEYANAFTELNDPIDQYERFEAQVKEKELGNDEATEMDLDYVEALEYGLPPAGGMGMGLDRLVMMLTGSETIREVILFPTMKKKD